MFQRQPKSLLILYWRKDGPDILIFLQLHRELAREAVRKSLVLLKYGKNPENLFLPLDRTAKRILVAGSHADNLGYQCGGWTSTWFGGSGRITIGKWIYIEFPFFLSVFSLLYCF